MKKIVFVTGTRADFGKLQPLIRLVENSKLFECHVFVTGIHMMMKYGSTVHEVMKEGYRNIYPFNNQSEGTDTDIALSNTISGFSYYVKELKPDLIIVHGDRVEALAGAIVGTINNVLVAHIEGGEISGTVDEILRHAITKLSHLHFVSNEKAKKLVVQLGEAKNSVFVIGSPDIDVMLSKDLPSLAQTKKRYGIPFKNYNIFCYHPVTTELDVLAANIDSVVKALLFSRKNYVVILPNNDKGCDVISKALDELEGRSSFKIFPSIRFRHFLTLLKNADCFVGNSSVGVREAGIYGVPSVNIGSRQKNRSKNRNIIHVTEREFALKSGFKLFKIAKTKTREDKKFEFGEGGSAKKFMKIIGSKDFWKIRYQKQMEERRWDSKHG